jgi:hypothetical protein
MKLIDVFYQGEGIREIEHLEVGEDVAVHRGIYASSARTATATNDNRLVLHGTVPQLYPRRAA